MILVSALLYMYLVIYLIQVSAMLALPDTGFCFVIPGYLPDTGFRYVDFLPDTGFYWVLT